MLVFARFLRKKKTDEKMSLFVSRERESEKEMWMLSRDLTSSDLEKVGQDSQEWNTVEHTTLDQRPIHDFLPKRHG